MTVDITKLYFAGFAHGSKRATRLNANQEDWFTSLSMVLESPSSKLYFGIKHGGRIY